MKEDIQYLKMFQVYLFPSVIFVANCVVQLDIVMMLNLKILKKILFETVGKLSDLLL